VQSGKEVSSTFSRRGARRSGIAVFDIGIGIAKILAWKGRKIGTASQIVIEYTSLLNRKATINKDDVRYLQRIDA